MSVRLYFDVHVPIAIADALRLRGVDVLRAQEDGSAEFEDPRLLDRATDLSRVLFTQDKGFLREANRRHERAEAFSGLVYAHQLNVTIGECVTDLELIAKSSDLQATASRDQLTPVMAPIFGIERPDGRIFTLELAGGKQAVLVFTSSDTAGSIRDLLIEKRLGGPFRVFEVQIPRETFESIMVPKGANADDFLFVYEDEEMFGRVIGSLENYHPPS